ncbi:HPr-rel-A system PqqD family peptide chaperone [Rubrivirga sp.]|uniref:HPr-rel-A system PqqD family peptide chaperone n=1 Tax=Rubrivirga sp. TaxID=1885344 RepID=UPI003C762E81
MASPDLTLADLGDEAVVLDPSSGTYFGLNAVATRIITLATDPVTTDELVDRLLTEFEVDRHVLARDIAGFVSDLVRRGILITQ